MQKGALISATLAVLLVSQAVYLGDRALTRRKDTEERNRLEAERVRMLSAIDTGHVRWVHLQGGDSISLAELRGTDSRVAFLAFSDHCQWCDSVATIWRDSVKQTPGVALVYVTSNTPVAARSYMATKGWDGRVLSLDTLRTTPAERALIARTPWVTVIDRSERRGQNFHGGELPRFLEQNR